MSGASLFHLAIPCRDLAEAKAFYVDGIGARVGREMPDRVTLDFFGDQVVCHLAPDKIDESPQMYPRHFGRTFFEREAFDALHQRALDHGLPFYSELKTRFEGRRDEHLCFFLIDPSNNLLEFKFYYDPEMVY